MAGKKGKGRPRTLPDAQPRPCEWCGTIFTPIRKKAKQRFCSALCQRRWRCRPEVNAEIARRSKFKRGSMQRWKGDPSGYGYVKFHGRHIHRILAELKVGRKLVPGEVVHHVNGDKRDNSPENLEVVFSQAEHARLHNFARWRRGHAA
jgi:uncharacterized OB-fold protein